MKKINRFLIAAAITVTAVSAVVPASPAPVSADHVYDYAHHTFKDVSGRYDEPVSFFYDFEIIKGISATEFGTYKSLTRGDAAVILANTLALDTESAPNAGFTDLNSRVAGAVNALAEAGIVSGVTPTEFKPGQTLSRGAMAKILVRAFELEEYSVDTPFTDAIGVFGPYIEALYGTGITSGTTATTYGTSANIRRGDFAVLLYNTLWFDIENSYYPQPADAVVTSPTTIQVTLTEAVPAEYTALDTGDLLYISALLEDGTDVYFEPTAYTLSPDRTVLTVEHKNYDLTGKAGSVFVEDFEVIIEAPFNFK